MMDEIEYMDGLFAVKICWDREGGEAAVANWRGGDQSTSSPHEDASQGANALVDIASSSED